MVRALAGLALAFAASFAASTASAQAYPAHAIRLLVPTTAGGSVDHLARATAQWLQTRLGQPVVVDNRAGAGGTIAAEATATAPADGYTLFMGTVSSLATAGSLEKLPYDPVKSFAPIALVGVQNLVLVVRTDSPIRTVADVVKLAREQPGKFSYSSAGRGTGGHLSGELFSQLTGVPMLHVPYKGVSQALTDVIGGQITCTFASLASAHPLVDGGKLRAIAVTGRERAASFPDVPTMDEAGIKGYESSTWYALVAPAGTPQAIVDKLNAEVGALLAQPATKDQFGPEGIVLVGGPPQQLGRHIASEVDKWHRVIVAAKLDQGT